MGARRSLWKGGPDVGSLVLGGNVFGWTLNEPRSFEVLDAFADQGLRAIDTADVYSGWVPGNQGGESETILGAWMHQRKCRDRTFIITKVGMEMGSGAKGLSRAHILSSIEDSLRRLQTDYVDLYFAHVDDPATPLEETLEAFALLIESGKVRAIGASNYSAPRLSEALKLARERGLPPYRVLEPRYNLYFRAEFESNLQALCQEHDLGVIPYSALGRGFLTGKYRSERDFEKSPRGGGIRPYLTERGFRILAALDEISARLGVTPTSVAVAWLSARASVVAPIASATSSVQLTELVRGTELRLSPSHVARLDEASAEEPTAVGPQ
jgi:aryl-alcohol dehydrogenase-like predicted oxidoreductase